MTNLKTILISSFALVLSSQACANDTISFSHPSPASSTTVNFTAVCGEFEWEVTFSNSNRSVSGTISVRHDGVLLDKINNDNIVLKNYSRLELPSVTCTARENNDGLFATTDLLLLGVDKSGDNTDFLTQISVDEAMQFEIVED